MRAQPLASFAIWPTVELPFRMQEAMDRARQLRTFIYDRLSRAAPVTMERIGRASQRFQEWADQPLTIPGIVNEESWRELMDDDDDVETDGSADEVLAAPRPARRHRRRGRGSVSRGTFSACLFMALFMLLIFLSAGPTDDELAVSALRSK